MNKIIIGFIAGILITAATIISVPAIAQPAPIDERGSIGAIIPKEGDYVWLEAQTPTNANIANVYTGAILTGYYDKDQQIPIIRWGFVIEYETEPTPEELKALDLEMSTKGLYREGGTTIKDELEAIKADIALSVGK